MLDLNRYEVDYGAIAGEYRADAFGFQLVLDFSKFLAGKESSRTPQLKTFYRSDWSKTPHHYGDEELALNHSIMTTLSFDFQ